MKVGETTFRPKHNVSELRSARCDGHHILSSSRSVARTYSLWPVKSRPVASIAGAGNGKYSLLMIGGGQQFEVMARAVKAHGLEDSFRFRTYQERAMLPRSLTVPDVHWLSLDPQLEGLIVPSKF